VQPRAAALGSHLRPSSPASRVAARPRAVCRQPQSGNGAAVGAAAGCGGGSRSGLGAGCCSGKRAAWKPDFRGWATAPGRENPSGEMRIPVLWRLAPTHEPSPGTWGQARRDARYAGAFPPRPARGEGRRGRHGLERGTVTRPLPPPQEEESK